MYHIGALAKRTNTLRDLLAESVLAPFRRAGRLLRGQAGGAAELDEIIWALRDVSFDVTEGEVVGIIGRNGAGKSTLLKILSRITEPSTGFADIHGRVGSLLEVGTGFHHELTGGENIYLNGAILGMRRSEIQRKFDEIVSFAEVGRFINTPVKHYSSGMYLRLAFAVAAHLEPEILMVDEVLAVGDAAFQRKCLGKMGSVANEGRTVLFVSHNMAAITQLCGRALWIDDGRLRMSGPSVSVVNAYLSAGSEGRAVWVNASPLPARALEVRLKSASILSQTGEPSQLIDFSASFKVQITYDVLTLIRDLSVTFQVSDSQGNLIFEAMDTDLPELKGHVREPGFYKATCQIPGYLLMPGRYYVTIVSFVDNIKVIERQENILTFDITEVGYRLNVGRLGMIAPVLKWQVGRAAEISDETLTPAADPACL